MRKQYPDLADVVLKEMLGGWGVSQHPGSTTIRPTRVLSDSASNRSRIYNLLLIIVALLVIGAAIYLARATRLAGKLFGPSVEYSEDQLAEAIRQQNWTSFDGMMQHQITEIVDQAGRSRAVYQQWIPFLRVYAYRHDGTIEGLKPKMLRGLGNFAAPLDCSIATFKERWQQNLEQTVDVVQGIIQPTTEQQRMLFWDPHWLKRRVASGWVIPRNYYEACLGMSLRAVLDLRQTSSVNAQAVYGVIAARLAAILNIANSIPLTAELDSSKFLNIFNCIDSGEDAGKLNSCVTDANEFGAWRDYLQSRLAAANIRLLLRGQSNLDEAKVVLLTNFYNNFHGDELTKFDYQPETRWFRLIMSMSGNVNSALQKLREEFPEVDMKNL